MSFLPSLRALPLLLVAQEPATSTISAGDTAWVLMSTHAVSPAEMVEVAGS